MAQLVEYVDELVQEVGPRPAGTLQEHQAAELIAARLDGFGMSVDIEEFSCARNLGWVRALYYALGVIGAAVAVFTPIPALGVVFVIIGAALMFLDYLGRNPLFSLFSSSLSQNVIARYSPPGNEQSGHTRKVVVMAHYDSPRTTVQTAPPLIAYYAQLRRAIRVTMSVLVVFSILLIFPFPEIVRTIIVIITGIATILVLLALLAEIINFFMPYSQGANCNGSSIGVLYGLAQILTSGVDVASFRNATGQTKKRQVAQNEAKKRTERRTRGSQAERDSREGQKGNEPAAGTAAQNDSEVSNVKLGGGFMGVVRQRGAKRTTGEVAPPGPTEQDAQDGVPSLEQKLPMAGGQQAEHSSPLQSKRGSAVTSVGDNLVNPFISQRPPLAEIEAAKRLKEEEQAKRLEEHRKRLQKEAGLTEDGVPAWFAKAKQSAEERAERRRSGTEGTDVVRSRFADIPTTGKIGEAKAQADDEEQVVGEEQEQALGQEYEGEESEESRAFNEYLRSGTAGSFGRRLTEAAWLDDREISDASRPVERREAVPITIKPDFTGIDKAAFKVLPGDENTDVKIIVPAETAAMPAAVAAETEAPFRGRALEDVDDDGQVSMFPRGDLRGKLRDLPSFSKENTGNIPVQQATLDEALVAKEDIFSSDNSLVSATGAFVPLGTTGVMKPLGEELLEYHDESEIYIHDADDTSITDGYSKNGEYSESELVNIPESRVKSFFGDLGDRFSGRKKEKLDNAPSSWLGVDKNFDARKEGHDIGSWDNFNEDEWSGGAYGGESRQENVNAVMNLSNELLDKEVWLVALGAGEAKSGGLKSLFAEHTSELKNALFINILGVGVGNLVFTVSEGNYRPAQTDHRMQNLITTAAQSMAIPIAPVSFSAFETDATAALKEGARAISIMGLGNKTPINWRWSDEEASHLSEDNLLDAVALVIETIKNI